VLDTEAATYIGRASLCTCATGTRSRSGQLIGGPVLHDRYRERHRAEWAEEWSSCRGPWVSDAQAGVIPAPAVPRGPGSGATPTCAASERDRGSPGPDYARPSMNAKRSRQQRLASLRKTKAWKACISPG
jgi:hypothetical protein